MLKTKGALLGIAATVVVAGLTIASMAVTTTSGAGTDNTDATPTTVAAQPTVAPSTPPQSPVEPPTNPVTTNAGNQAGAGTLPSAGYGTAGTNGAANTMVLLGLAAAVLAAGTALMVAGGKIPGGRKA
ncbi:MAG: hypothetical protein HY873_08255 [Chloroflexi bacterium]|nr:hypothetical protein [Chloroflexota bacterium]